MEMHIGNILTSSQGCKLNYFVGTRSKEEMLANFEQVRTESWVEGAQGWHQALMMKCWVARYLKYKGSARKTFVTTVPGIYHGMKGLY